jgi:hypothetical protein
VRLPFAVIAVLLAVLLVVGFAADSGSEDAAPAARPAADVATIAARVERLRGLRFDAEPRPETVTPEQATEEGLADLDRAYPRAARAADETLYAMLGLLPRGTDLRELSASVFGEEVAGYYDPRTDRLRVVEGAGSGQGRVLDEIVMAHELVHALEDQRVGLDTGAAERSDDAGYAYKALVEGTATAVMFAYLGRHFGAEEALGGILGSAFAGGGADLPPFVLAGLLFPYERGERFVNDLYRRTGSWELVDVALRERPPASTEQVLHPDKWMAAEEPQRVGLPAPGRGWGERTSGTFGEWQTGQLLALAGGDWRRASEGWGGDRYALYGDGERDLLMMRWTHDSARDGAEFARALQDYVDEALPAGPVARIAAGDRGVMLVLAPDGATARRIASTFAA